MGKPKIRFKGFTEDWEQRKLSDIVDVLDGDRGKNYPTSDDFDDSGHTIFLNASNVTNEGFLFQDNQFITEEKSNSMGNGKLEEDDIIITSRGSLGHIAWYNTDILRLVPYARINSGMFILRNKQEIETEYLYHFLKSDKGQSQISFMSFGSAQPQLTKKGVESLEVVLPPKSDEQLKIGDYFDHLDHLITLHQRKCDETKKLKKYMLQKMFPQNGMKVPEIRFEGFTGDWEQRKLGEIVSVCSGKDYKHLDEGNIPVYGTGGYMLSVSEALSNDSDAIGIGRKGTIDKPYILKAPFWTVDTLFYCIPHEKNDLSFVFSTFQNINWKAMDESTGVPSLSKTAINCVDVITPLFEEQKKIGCYFSNLDHLITLHQRKCDELVKIKKYMLQNMFV